MYPMAFMNKLISAYQAETNKSAKGVIKSIIDNVLIASELGTSICQDTGIPTFHVFMNPNCGSEKHIKDIFTEVIIESTENLPLRKNVIEPFSYKNTGNNTGWHSPFVHYYCDKAYKGLRIRAELKGFGGELKGSYGWIFTSAKSMENAVLAFVLNSMLLSKGEACLPSFMGVGVGGYGADAVMNAKAEVFRELNGKLLQAEAGREDKRLTAFEDRLFRCVNRLGLGPMGIGGNTTTLATYVGRYGAHTAAASIAVCHQCWANRASEALIEEGKIRYLTRHVEKEDVYRIKNAIGTEQMQASASRYEIELPFAFEKLRDLKVGDVVYLSGKVCTAREGAHRRMLDLSKAGKAGEIPKEITDYGCIYHCGPITKKNRNKWMVTAAGPTTSSRFTEHGAYLVQNGIVNVVVGKGMMGTQMTNAMKGRGIYLKATGGCAVNYAKMIENTEVKWLDLGEPEAVWVLDMVNFGPLIVGIDSRGRSLSTQIMEGVYENAYRIYQEEGLRPDTRYQKGATALAGLSLNEVIEICRSA